MSQYFLCTRLRTLACIGFFWFGLLINANGQEPQVPPQNSSEQVGKTEKTVIDMTEQELRQFYHDELHSLKFDPSQDQLDHLLKKVGDSVVSFFRDFSNVSSKERVEMSKTHKIDAFYNTMYADCTGSPTPSLDFHGTAKD
jgi:hypothetical protein